ncbi:tetratricopeptide repeat protein [Algoriphagus aestuariicola]|uniref:Tetratricopeptide repeat protein n=1 Tax=Algoriphagus aestuariicola TaxID=1852016 RepID=A0ABS3BJI8_9BACT|nr:tetratricopeptide repeat protein [Algoriphagus aestuariicola]MBN7799468.1 tetratricopeptide repeat protein [Algoriphagus aestuariicola]
MNLLNTTLLSALRASLLLAVLILAGCTSEKTSEAVATEPTVRGLDGRLFSIPQLSEKSQARLDSNLQVARANFESNPTEENYIWLGRRQAYAYHYAEAIKTFTEGLTHFPDSYKLYRHRGHRYLTTRDFAKATADFEKAAALMPQQPLEIEPDGIPNKLNIPLSTTQFNVWYHLGLAHYLQGNFESAAKAYEQCMLVSDNDDLICATADWLYMSYQKLGKKADAQQVLELISPEGMEIIENESYYLRLQMYKGLLPAEELLSVDAESADADLALATQGYGVGNWYLIQGDTTRAKEIFQQVVAGKNFSAFGFIASEVELDRLK